MLYVYKNQAAAIEATTTYCHLLAHHLPCSQITFPVTGLCHITTARVSVLDKFNGTQVGKREIFAIHLEIWIF